MTSGKPALSPGVTRTHCGRCGAPMTYASERNAQVDLYIGTLDDPLAAVPTYHVHVAEQLAWFETTDTLPRYARGKSSGDPPVRHRTAPNRIDYGLGYHWFKSGPIARGATLDAAAPTTEDCPGAARHR